MRPRSICNPVNSDSTLLEGPTDCEDVSVALQVWIGLIDAPLGICWQVGDACSPLYC